MVKKLLKDIKNDGGNTKIDVDEVATLKNGEFKLLNEIIDVEIIKANRGICEKHPDGRMICYSDGLYNMAGNNLINPLDVTFPIPFAKLQSLQHSVFRSSFDSSGQIISRVNYASVSSFKHAHEAGNQTGVRGSYVAYGIWEEQITN